MVVNISLGATPASTIKSVIASGGMGTLYGPLLGAAMFLVLEDVLSAHTEHWMVVLGPLLVLIVLFARRGVYGALTGRGRADV